MFTNENLRNYAVLSAMGATPRLLLTMVFAQAGVCGLIGTGLGLGLSAIIGQLAIMAGFPFRMMWFTPLLGTVTVVLVSVVAAVLSVRPVLKLEPSLVFSGR
jgi:putative ABC transport system permease protein